MSLSFLRIFIMFYLGAANMIPCPLSISFLDSLIISSASLIKLAILIVYLSYIVSHSKELLYSEVEETFGLEIKFCLVIIFKVFTTKINCVLSLFIESWYLVIT